MRSKHADRFNHDDEAAGYDADVANAADPVRAGYDELLGWVAREAGVTSGLTVLELGSGTGNLTARLTAANRIVAVDVSWEMTRIAREKLAGHRQITWVQDDLLGYFDDSSQTFDRVVSTYAIHHLTQGEKALLLRKVREALSAGGRAVFGDLMFRNAGERRQILDELTSAGQEALAADIQDEFPWRVDSSQAILESLGFAVEAKRFSELSWGLCCRL